MCEELFMAGGFHYGQLTTLLFFHSGDTSSSQGALRAWNLSSVCIPRNNTAYQLTLSFSFWEKVGIWMILVTFLFREFCVAAGGAESMSEQMWQIHPSLELLFYLPDELLKATKRFQCLFLFLLHIQIRGDLVSSYTVLLNFIHIPTHNTRKKEQNYQSDLKAYG